MIQMKEIKILNNKEKCACNCGCSGDKNLNIRNISDDLYFKLVELKGRLRCENWSKLLQILASNYVKNQEPTLKTVQCNKCMHKQATELTKNIICEKCRSKINTPTKK